MLELEAHVVGFPWVGVDWKRIFGKGNRHIVHGDYRYYWNYKSKEDYNN